MAGPVKAPSTVDVTVRAIAAGGSGIGDLPDGRVVFVPRTVPGDRARIEVRKQKARWAVGSLRRIVEPGPSRTEALCSLYAECGGCQLQHLSYEQQLEWKGRFVSDALERLGGLEGVEPPEVVASPKRVGYRTRMSFTLRRLRGGRVVAGLHGLGRPAHVVDVTDECVLPTPSLLVAWQRLRAAWGEGASRLPRGGRLRLTIRDATPGFELLVEGGEAGWDAGGLAERVPGLVAVRHRTVKGDGVSVRETHTGDDALGTAFEQVNTDAARDLRAHVVDLAGSRGGRAVDAYCGTGDLAARLVEAGWSVVGIETDPDAVALARGREGVRVVHGPVEAHLAAHLPTDLLIVNPPRSGLHGDVPSIIEAAPPQRIVYVSCDPATLARDVEALTDTFELSGLRAYDLFPQTAHVETVALLERRQEEPR